MEYFSINQDMKYIIYGAGGNCYHIKKLFQEAGYSITAVLDKRAKDIISIEGVPVHLLENFSVIDEKKENSVIIISVKNVFEHINIVRDLLESGYKNIIYKPFPVLQGEYDEEWNNINSVYESIVERNEIFDLRGKKIVCSRCDHLMVFKDELLIEEDGKNVMCWIPVELICNYNREDAFNLLPMAAYYPLLNMYRYLLGVEIICEWKEIKSDFFLYAIDWVERTNNKFSDSLKNSMLNSRINVFGEMQKKADIDKDFFKRNAVSVKRIDSIRFSLSTSGRNRVSFLIATGHRFVPVYMSREDYNCWINECKFKKFKQYLEKMKINKLFTMVQHPMMSSFTSETTDYVSLFCMPVVKEIYRLLHWKSADKKNDYYKINLEQYDEEIAKLKIFSANKDEGCIGRLLLMYGINCYRLYFDEKQEKISSFIDEMFYMKDTNTVLTGSEIDVLRECQILIVDSQMMCPFIEQFQGSTIFVLQWEKDNHFNNWLDNIYTNRKMLFQTIWKHEKVSGWMLKRGQTE